MLRTCSPLCHGPSTETRPRPPTPRRHSLQWYQPQGLHLRLNRAIAIEKRRGSKHVIPGSPSGRAALQIERQRGGDRRSFTSKSLLVVTADTRRFQAETHPPGIEALVMCGGDPTPAQLGTASRPEAADPSGDFSPQVFARAAKSAATFQQQVRVQSTRRCTHSRNKCGQATALVWGSYSPRVSKEESRSFPMKAIIECGGPDQAPSISHPSLPAQGRPRAVS